MNRLIAKMAWRNIWRQKNRSIIAISSVLFASLFCIILTSYGNGVTSYIVDSFVARETGNIQIIGKDYWDEKIVDNFIEIEETELAKYEAVDNVIRIAPRMNNFAMGWNGTKTRALNLISIDPKREIEFSKLDTRIIEGSFLSQEDDGVIIGSKCAEIMGLGVGDTLALMGMGYHGANAANLFVIKGVVECYDSLQDAITVYTSLSAGRNFISMPNGVSTISILLKDDNEIEPTIQEFSKLIANEDIVILPWEELIKDGIAGAMEEKKSMMVFFYFLYIIVFFGLLSTVIMLTNERIKEFGVMSALGTKKKNLISGISLELMMLNLSGLFLGILISLPIVANFHYNPIELTGTMAAAYDEYGIEAILPFEFSAKLFIEQIIIVFTMSVIVTLYPIGKIKKMKIIDALKHS